MDHALNLLIDINGRKKDFESVLSDFA